VAKELGATKEIPILKWTWKCWNCGNATPVVSYCLEANYLQSIGMIEKLDLILVEKYLLIRISCRRSHQIAALIEKLAQ